MDRIGIICASDTELAPFLNYIHDVTISEKAMLKFYKGKIRNADVVALYSGVCKVNAAIAAQILIDDFNTNIIINAGTAGGINENVQLFDTVVSELVAYHDVADDILTEFHPWLKSVYFQSNDKLLHIAKQCSRSFEYPILFGKTVTGEQFIEDNEREKINRKFSPLSVDMETAGIAHVCYVNKVPFIAIRTITDTAMHIGIENFEKNCETASEISAKFVIAFITELVQ